MSYLGMRSATREADAPVESDESVGMDETTTELPDLTGDSTPRCECDHGTETEYIACGRRARWRVSVDCVCGEGHPRRVEILCSRCLSTLRRDYGREAITVRKL